MNGYILLWIRLTSVSPCWPHVTLELPNLTFFKNIYILEKSTSEETFPDKTYIISIFKTFWDFGMKASKS